MRSIARLLRTLRGTSGQALPVAIAALAIGAVLVTPLLQGASTSSRFTNQVGQRARERYSMDAGIEWSGWRLIGNPVLTTDTTFSATPIAPLPATINGASFPVTEIRFVSGAGAVERQAPAWQNGGGDQCYTFSASDAGTLSVHLTVDSGQAWIAVLADGSSCTRPPGLPPVFGSSPYAGDFTIGSAGTYQLLVGTDTATTGAIQMSVPAATYEARSLAAGRSAIARLVAGYAGVRVDSWQLN